MVSGHVYHPDYSLVNPNDDAKKQNENETDTR